MSNVSNTTTRPDLLPRWLPLGLLALILVALFYRLCLGEVLFWGLPALQFYPWREFATRELAAGRFPLWNPFNGGGAPLFANYQSALLYPPHMLYLLFPGPVMMGLMAVAHVFWASVGMYWFTGRLGLPTFGRAIAVLAYPLSGTLIARLGTFPMLEVAAWLPWLMALVDWLIEQPRMGRMAALALATGMVLLVGHAQWTYYSFLLVGSYALWRVLAERRPALRLVLAALGVMLGVGLAAVQLLPTAELQRQSQRATGVDEPFALNFSFAPISALTFFNADFFGNPGEGTYIVGGAYFENAAYIGFLPISLALIGVWQGVQGMRSRRRLTPTLSEGSAGTRHLLVFFCLVALISLLFATGQEGPIYRFLYRSVPTFNLFQAPARWLLLTSFSLAMLAALASREWKPGRRSLYVARLGLVAAGTLIGIGLAGMALLASQEQGALLAQLAEGIAVAGVLMLITAVIFAAQPRPGQTEQRRRRWMIAALIFLAIDLGWANARSNPTTTSDFYAVSAPGSLAQSREFRTQRQIDQLMFNEYLSFANYRLASQRRDAYRSADLPNLNLLDRRPTWNNFEPLRPDWVEHYTRLLTGYPADTAIGQSLRQTAFIEGGATPLTRVWVVGEVQPVRNADAAEKAITAENWNPRATAILETDQTDPPLNMRGGAGTAQIDQETPLELQISAESPTGGALILADTWYPGWQVTVDGAVAALYRANVAFRAVILAPGRHSVHVFYQPQSLGVGFLISLVSGAGLVCLGMLAIFRRTRDPA